MTGEVQVSLHHVVDNSPSRGRLLSFAVLLKHRDMTNLLALSAELHELIYGDLDATDQLAFLSVCQTLYQSFRVSWTCDAVQQKLVKKRQVVAIWDDVQARVVGEEGKEKKIGKLRPMVVVGVRVEETDIILSVYLPSFFPRNDAATKHGDIMVEGDHAGVYMSRKKADAGPEAGRQVLEVVLGRAALVRMTGSMLRRYWGRNCPECRGSRSICPGCGGVSVRWVECFASCGCVV